MSMYSFVIFSVSSHSSGHKQVPADFSEEYEIDYVAGHVRAAHQTLYQLPAQDFDVGTGCCIILELGLMGTWPLRGIQSTFAGAEFG
ncbi:hypothetical protein H2200_010860, partial [Cladophialophora chaetospira]